MAFGESNRVVLRFPCSLILSNAISMVAQSCCTLQELILEKNDILKDGAVALANALGSNEVLQTLVLKCNRIGDVGAIAIGTMLQRNKTLNILDLSSCSIGSEGGMALGHGLAENASLQHLLLDKNSLGAGSDTSFFSTGVSKNKVLKGLHFSCNCLAANGDVELWGRAIADALLNNSSLQNMSIYQAMIYRTFPLLTLWLFTPAWHTLIFLTMVLRISVSRHS